MHSSIVLVVDTNVLVAAGFNPGSASARIVEGVRSGALRMAWNEATRREIERVVRRIPPLRSLSLDPLFLPEHRYEGETDPGWFAHVPDPDDRKFAALARAAGAILVSSDDHLLRHVREGELVVLTPGALWRRWCGGDPAEG
jgi:predicted nucleic acid-binding protein